MEITGIAGIEETLANLVAAVAKKQEQAARGVARAGFAYQGDVQRVAPVDTGQYRASIRTTPVMHTPDGAPYVEIGTPLPQACRLEFGYDNMTDRLGRTFHQKPQPHFLNTMELNKEKYLDIIKAELEST